MIIDTYFLKKSIKLILDKLKIEENQYSLNDLILKEMCVYINKDIDKYKLAYKEEADEFQFASFVTFWFRKLKPLIHQKTFFTINEYVGVHLGINIIRSERRGKIKNFLEEYYFNEQKLEEYLKSHLDELCFILRYRAASPHIICLLLKTLIFFSEDLIEPQLPEDTPLNSFLRENKYFLKPQQKSK